MSRLNRYQEIALTLRRHGLGFLTTALGVNRWIPARRGGQDEQPQEQPHTAPVRLRLALEDLGPTFVKLGQLLATRADLLPQPYIAELSKLHDSASPVPADVIREALRDELGDDPSDVFAEFEIVPLASASIGQAHSATLHDGTPVVVKVRRPDAVRQVHEDLEILQNLADRASRLWEPARAYNLRGLVQEFAQTLRAELDYLREGRNAERFAVNFETRPKVVIPRVYWETTTSRVLTLERMTGIKITDIAALDAAGIDRRALALTGAQIVLQMIFEDRFFHADLHPGNLFVHATARSPSSTSAWSARSARSSKTSSPSTSSPSPRGIPTRWPGRSSTSPSPGARSIGTSCVRPWSRFVSDYEGRSLSEVSFTRLTTGLLAALREQHLQLPREVALIFKVLLMVESIGLILDPHFDFLGVFTPYARRLVKERLSPAAIARRVANASADAGELLLEMPRRLRRILEVMDRSGVEVHLRAAELEPLVARTERIGNRLVAGMIAAALIRGVGGLVAGRKRWKSWESGLMGAGVTATSTLVGYLLWTARRHRP